MKAMLKEVEGASTERAPKAPTITGTFNAFQPRQVLKDDRLLKPLMGHKTSGDVSDYRTWPLRRSKLKRLRLKIIIKLLKLEYAEMVSTKPSTVFKV